MGSIICNFILFIIGFFYIYEDDVRRCEVCYCSNCVLIHSTDLCADYCILLL